MKRSVIFDDVHESNIRPQKVYGRYLELLETEVRKRFVESSFVPVLACPACRTLPSKEVTFTKWGFQYKRCPQCRTLFADPTPRADILKSFHDKSEALAFWGSEVLASSSEERKEHLFRLRLDWILSFIDADQNIKQSFIDYGARDLSFWKEAARIKIFNPLSGCHVMALGQSVPENSGFKVITSLPKGRVDVITAFETLETTSDPAASLKEIGEALSESGLLFVTTRAGSGFDMQLLGGHSPNLLPPLHLTMLSVEGAAALLDSLGFETLELSTPGQLDVELVANAIKTDSTIVLPPLLDDIIRRRNETIHHEFQEFLQNARLSSHLRIAARRKSEKA